MAKSISELLIKLGVDTKEFDNGVKKAKDGLGGLEQKSKATGESMAASLGLATGAVAALGAAYLSLARKGNEFNELSGAFERLRGGPEKAARSLDVLRGSFGGLLSDVQIFKSANLAASFDITNESFDALAKSAEALGDAVGVDVVESMDALVRAMGTGQTRSLKMLGITIDQTKAEEAFAQAIGRSGEKLNEEGKLQATRIAILEKVQEKYKSVASESTSVNEGTVKLSNAFENLIGRIGSAADANKDLAQALDEVAGFINSIDTTKLVNNLIAAGQAAIQVSPAFSGLASAIDLYKKAASPEGQQQLGFIKDLSKNIPLIGSVVTVIDQYRGKTAEVTNEKAKATSVEDSYTKAIELQKAAVKGISKNLIETGDSAKKAAEDFQKFTDKLDSDKLKIEADKIKDSFDRIFSSITGSGQTNFQTNISSGASVFNSQLESLKKNVKESYIQGLEGAQRSDPRALAAAEEYANKAAKEYQDKFADAVSTTAVKLGDELKQQIQASADFFSDAFYNVFTGAAFDFEDMLKRVGAGLAGGILGNLFPEFGGIGDLQGLGQKIGGEIIKGIAGSATGGGSGLLSSILAPLGLGAAGQYGVTGGLIGPAQAGGAGLGLAGLGIAGAAAATTIFVVNANKDNFSKGDSSQAAGYAAIDSIFPGVGSAISSVLGIGGKGKGALEREARENFISSLGDRASFQGVRGQIDLNASGYNFNNGAGRSQFSDRAVGLTTGIAASLAGDSDKLREDLNNIFADAIDDGKSFAEVLINAQGLMSALGVDAGKAKDDITQAFLQGKVSLEEYNAAFNSLNELTRNNIEGTGNVDAAIKVLGDTTATVAAKIQATALAFVEMKEVGIDTSKETSAFLTDRYGPEIAKVFQNLANIGIDSFEEIKSASSDQLNTVINSVASLSFSETFINESARAESYVIESNRRITDSYNRVRDAANEAAKASGTLGGDVKGLSKAGAGNASKINENKPNTEFVP